MADEDLPQKEVDRLLRNANGEAEVPDGRYLVSVTRILLGNPNKIHISDVNRRIDFTEKFFPVKSEIPVTRFYQEDVVVHILNGTILTVTELGSSYP